MNDNTPSSIGAAWPPVEASHNRLRGFYPEAVRSPQELNEFLNHFEHARERAQNHDTINRLSIRAVAHRALVGTLDREDLEIEGALPVKGTDVSLIYTAWNAPERRSAPEDLVRHQMLLKTAAARPTDSRNRTDSLHAKGFTPRLLDRTVSDRQKAALTDRFTELYSHFGYNLAEVRELLLNPANTIVYIEDSGGIVSTAMAERASLAVAGHGDLNMAEITEAFTLPAYRGRGLYKDVSGLLIRNLLDNPLQQPDIIYGESNLTMPGVIIAARQNGRRFSYCDRAALGINQPAFGILQQNFRVEDGTETRPYNDFALSYIPLD
jgi:hypothetical protein